MVALVDLDCGLGVHECLALLLAGLGRPQLTRHLERGRGHFAMPVMWATSWRTSHAVQSVGRVQPSGARASTASATRSYSVSASRIAVGRAIAAWTVADQARS